MYVYYSIYITLILYYALCFAVTPHTRCRLKLLKLERIKDFLLMEEELIQNQEILKPQEQKNEVSFWREREGGGGGKCSK